MTFLKAIQDTLCRSALRREFTVAAAEFKEQDPVKCSAMRFDALASQFVYAGRRIIESGLFPQSVERDIARRIGQINVAVKLKSLDERMSSGPYDEVTARDLQDSRACILFCCDRAILGLSL